MEGRAAGGAPGGMERGGMRPRLCVVIKQTLDVESLELDTPPHNHREVPLPLVILCLLSGTIVVRSLHASLFSRLLLSEDEEDLHKSPFSRHWAL